MSKINGTDTGGPSGDADPPGGAAINDAAVTRLAKLFVGSTEAHGTHGEPKKDPKDPDSLKWPIKSTAKTLRMGATMEMWRQHVAGTRPLGVIPITKHSTCSWGSIDVDEYDWTSYGGGMMEVVDRVNTAKLPLVPCISKSGGLHLFLFLKKAEPATDLQSALRDALPTLDLPSTTEIFPKQTSIDLERRDKGNWMVMPYYGGTFGEKLKMQRGVKEKGAEMTIEEFVSHAEGKQTTVEEFAALCKPAGRQKQKRSGGAAAPRGSAVEGGEAMENFSNGPPCLQSFHGEAPHNDMRDRYLSESAVYLKRADPLGWENKLRELNQRDCLPEMPRESVDKIINSYRKRDYQYKCREEPSASRCDRSTCRTRKFGVGEAGACDFLGEIVKIDSEEEPMYKVMLGNKEVTMSPETLWTFRLFKMAYCIACDKPPPQNYKQSEWEVILGDRMVGIKREKAGPGVNLSDQFLHHLTEHVTNRARADRREQLRDGKPWHDVKGGRYYFTMESLRRYLMDGRIHPFYTESATKLGQRIRKIEGADGRPPVRDGEGRNKSIHAWFVPADKIVDRVLEKEMEERSKGPTITDEPDDV